MFTVGRDCGRVEKKEVFLMFKYENGRIKWMGASIELQNGMYINPEPVLVFDTPHG